MLQNYVNNILDSIFSTTTVLFVKTVRTYFVLPSIIPWDSIVCADNKTLFEYCNTGKIFQFTSSDVELQIETLQLWRSDNRAFFYFLFFSSLDSRQKVFVRHVVTLQSVSNLYINLSTSWERLRKYYISIINLLLCRIYKFIASVLQQ